MQIADNRLNSLPEIDGEFETKSGGWIQDVYRIYSSACCVRRGCCVATQSKGGSRTLAGMRSSRRNVDSPSWPASRARSEDLGILVMKLTESQLKLIDTAALAGVSFSLLEAFYYQLVLGELPCAFCNLIRVAFMIFGAGLLMNLRFGTNPWNYVISAVGSLIGSLISLLFMFAKAPKYTIPTGSAIFGLHMYTWSFIVFTGATMYCVFLLAFRSEMIKPEGKAFVPSRTRPFVMGLFVFLVAANLVSAFLENGFHTFRAGGQQHYQMLYDGDVMKPGP